MLWPAAVRLHHHLMILLRSLEHAHCRLGCAVPIYRRTGGSFSPPGLLCIRKRRTHSLQARAPATAAFQYFATCHPGLETALVEELQDSRLEADSVKAGYSGAAFRSLLRSCPLCTKSPARRTNRQSILTSLSQTLA